MSIGPADAYTLSSVSARFADASLGYDPAHPSRRRGELFLPEAVDASTPVVLLVNGGPGVASHLLGWGHAVFSVDSEADDGVEASLAAAQYLLSGEAGGRLGFRPAKISLFGVGHGGDFVLKAGRALGDRVEKIVSIRDPEVSVPPQTGDPVTWPPDRVLRISNPPGRGIWRKGDVPHRLLGSLEKRIVGFLCPEAIRR